MPRNGSGSYSIPNPPFVPGTPISSSVTNGNNQDIADALTGSLARDGQGGMTGQFKATAGTIIAPGVSFVTDVNTGMRLSGTDELALVAGAADILTVGAGGATVAADPTVALGIATKQYADGVVGTMPEATIKGRLPSSGTGAPVNLTAVQARQTAGLAYTGTTDNAAVRFDSTTGQTQNSGVIIDDSNNVSVNSLTIAEIAAPSTPASGFGVVYAKSDGIPYFKNDAGTESAMTAGTTINYQVFTSSGTWNKPAGFSADSAVIIQAWAAGGGGGDSNGEGGGGGGAFATLTLKLSAMGSTETVTVGTSALQTAGGNTTVGSLITAYGGGFGSGNGGGGGGGSLSAGGNDGGNGGRPARGSAGNPGGDSTAGGGGGGNVSTAAGGSSFYGGGGGGDDDGNGGDSVFGGGGGGGDAPSTGGTSRHGGAGGADGVAGTAPGGGGGRGQAGGRGEVRIWVMQ